MIDEKIAAMGHWTASLVEARLARDPERMIRVARQLERAATEIRLHYEAHRAGRRSDEPAIPQP